MVRIIYVDIIAIGYGWNHMGLAFMAGTLLEDLGDHHRNYIAGHDRQDFCEKIYCTVMWLHANGLKNRYLIVT